MQPLFYAKDSVIGIVYRYLKEYSGYRSVK